ncbi:hypothetical protein PVAP13_5KG213607 [Panicum virgatum]|uniref:Uncharacterized protein n=1 Tax=Panicum virgatum TaxID=38727 RepID=A0A8T0SCW2_PANVG|nr:hypothetical protein PVAP13_5KG213607 [Panicum virgatum]
MFPHLEFSRPRHDPPPIFRRLTNLYNDEIRL